MSFWLVQVDNKYGRDILGLFKTKDGALNALYEWAKEYWNDETEMPEDRHEAIRQYFSYIEDYENYTIDEVEVTE